MFNFFKAHVDACLYRIQYKKFMSKMMNFIFTEYNQEEHMAFQDCVFSVEQQT